MGHSILNQVSIHQRCLKTGKSPCRLDEDGTKQACNSKAKKLGRDDQEDSCCRIWVFIIVEPLSSQNLGRHRVCGCSGSHDNDECMLLRVEWERIEEGEERALSWNQGEELSKGIANDSHEYNRYVDGLRLEIIDLLED